MNHRTLYWSLIIITPSLFSYVLNIIGLICDSFLLRFDLFFWDKVNKKYTNLEEPDLLFKCFWFWVLNKIESQITKLHDIVAAFIFHVSLAGLDLMFLCRKSILFYVEFSSLVSVPNVKSFINHYIPSYMPQCLLVPDFAQLLATRFLVLDHSVISLPEQIKKVVGHHAKWNEPLSLD